MVLIGRILATIAAVNLFALAVFVMFATIQYNAILSDLTRDRLVVLADTVRRPFKSVAELGVPIGTVRNADAVLARVASSDEAIEKIGAATHDVYLIDYRIDGRTGLDVLQEVRAIERLEPFILLTGVGDLDIERESLQLAASDYLVKKNLTSESLARALYYALGRKEQEKQKINHLLEINRSKDEFISIASHQLRTPVTTVKQYIAMVLDGHAGDLSEKQQRFLDKAYKSNERQLSIINNLLKVAQVDSGAYNLARQRIDVSEIVKSAAEDFTPIFASNNQTISSSYDIRAEGMVDESAIRMIIDNLLENACKYSRPQSNTHIAVALNLGMIEVSVEDHGVGVDEPDKLFKKFSRIENELSTEVGGTGLGLYWAQSVARLHDGDLVYEAHDAGSKFKLLLPSVK